MVSNIYVYKIIRNTWSKFFLNFWWKYIANITQKLLKYKRLAFKIYVNIYQF